MQIEADVDVGEANDEQKDFFLLKRKYLPNWQARQIGTHDRTESIVKLEIIVREFVNE